MSTEKGLCKYRNSLGEPGKGIHKYGAIADWAMTVALALFMAYITVKIHKHIKKKSYKEPFPFGIMFLIWFVSLYLLAIFLHYIFCVKTRVNVVLGLA